MSSRATPEFLILARILRPHGVRGDFSIQVLTDFPERLNELDTIYLGRDPDKPGKMTSHEITWIRHAKNDQWLMHLENIDNRNDAEPYRNYFMLVSLENAVPLEEDEVYLFQVMGLEVRTKQGEVLGRVVDMIETGANDVYVVQGEAHGEVLIPAIPDVVRSIDVEAGIMTVQLPDGLLP